MSNRTLPAGMNSDLQEIYTQSTWLIKVEPRGQSAIRASTEGQVTWNSETWLPLGFKTVGDISSMRMAFSMPNETGAVLSMVANKELRRAPVEVYVMYPGSSTAVEFLRGYVTSVTGLVTNRATLSVERYSDENMDVPGVFIAPPLFTKLPPTDLSFDWAGKRIVLKQRR